MLNPRRLLIVPLLAATMMLAPTVYADPTAAPAATLDAAPPVDAAPAAVTVDTEAGTVTPAPGTPAANVQDDPTGAVKDVVAAARAGNWRLVASVVLAAVMVLGVRFRLKVFGTTKRGKAIAVAILATLGLGSAALATDVPLDYKLALGVLTTMWIAVGARAWLGSLLWPDDGGKPYLEWLRPILGK